MQIVILKGHKQLLMDVLRRTPFLGKSFNFTEIKLLFAESLNGQRKKSKTEMHLKCEKVILVLQM